MIKGRVSIIIPGRCEVYFQQTIDGILDAAKGDIEIIAVVDGYIPNPPLIARDERVKIIQLEESIGQRAGYNLGVRNSTGEYVMKLDAHAAVSEGFDIELKKHCPEKTLVLPEMRRLDVKTWESKSKGHTWFMYFSLGLYCHFWRPYRRREESKVDYPEVFTGQGSCWFCRRSWNDYIGLLDEGVGSWGKVGIEVSLRTWLCGGSQILNKKVWQAHYFRKDEGGFPYPFSGRRVAAARDYVNKNYMFRDDAFPNQVRLFEWLIKKFAPIPGWEVYLADKYSKPRYIVYYTDHSVDASLGEACRSQLKKVAGPIPIICVSQKPIPNFGKNIVVGKKPRIYASMYEQLLEGTKACPPNSIVYLCEHDVFYHTSHFVKIPRDKNAMYFNTNRYYWKPGMNTYSPARDTRPFSHGVAYREYIIQNAEQRLEWWAENDSRADRVKIRWFKWCSEKPNVDVRHSNNFTKDGDSKRKYYAGQDLKAVRNLPNWGSPKHMMKKVHWKGPMRWDIINHILKINTQYKRYLEIGVRKRECLDRVICDYKDGIDPAGRCNYKMTSDAFFETTPDSQTYDLIFIDGLHLAGQVKKDIANSLKRLNKDGTIVMHDCNPISEQQQRVPRNGQKIWCGDTWKAFVGYREREDLEMCVVDTNNGIGIIRTGEQTPYSIPEVLDYDWLDSHRKRALNLVSVDKFKALGF